MLARETETDWETLKRLAKALGKPLPELQPVPDPAAPPRRVVGEGPASADSYLSARDPESTDSGPGTRQLTEEEIAAEVAKVMTPLVEALAKKGEFVVARWLLTVAGEANDQSVDNVRPLIDLARDFLWRADHVRSGDE